MSDKIPLEIQVEIMKKLPVKSLIQFRSVSKSWKHLIDTSDFITNYTGQHTQTQQHLLIVTNDYNLDSGLKYVVIADDDTFPQHKLPITCPLLGNMVNYPLLLGSSYGLLCLFYNGLDGSISRAIILNPCIRKSVVVAVDMPHLINGMYDAVLCFGVCRETRDPKLLKITHIRRKNDIESIDCIPRQVEVFTLSGGAWRTSYGNLPRKSIRFHTGQEVINGFLYLLASDRDSRRACSLVISFDLTTEEFSEINLPHTLTYGGLHMSKLRESLVLIKSVWEADEQVSVVWMMEDGVPELFTKLFTINTHAPLSQILGFRKSGDAIVLSYEDDCKLFVYEACSRNFYELRVDGIGCSVCAVCTYVETLLLLDQPNLKMFCLGN